MEWIKFSCMRSKESLIVFNLREWKDKSKTQKINLAANRKRGILCSILAVQAEWTLPWVLAKCLLVLQKTMQLLSEPMPRNQ